MDPLRGGESWEKVRSVWVSFERDIGTPPSSCLSFVSLPARMAIDLFCQPLPPCYTVLP